MSSAEVQNLIPNRPPYLWVDEVVSVDDQSIHTRKFIDPNLELFSGHYPDFPVFPAALQCECAFQASAILIAKLGVTTGHKVPVVARANTHPTNNLVIPLPITHLLCRTIRPSSPPLVRNAPQSGSRKVRLVSLMSRESYEHYAQPGFVLPW